MSKLPNPPSLQKPAKSHAVVHELRKHIVAKLNPGSQLPTYGEMEQVFGVSRGVLRQAVDRLKHDGFIYARDRRGLFVAERPPHLSRLAMVFAQNPASATWPRFFTALQQQAAGIEESRDDISFVNYHNVTLDSPNEPSESLEQLVRDVRAQRVAGLLLMPGTHELARYEPIAATATPKLFICGAAAAGYTPSITVDTRHMCRRMARWLRERGRERIAAVGMWESSVSLLTELVAQGMIHRPHWALTMGRDNAADVGKLVALLMDYPAEDRPDGLMVLDDNLAEHTLNGLIQSGIRIGQDLDIIAHCNWPWPVPCPAPVQRIGFNAGQLLEEAIRTIEQIKNGEASAGSAVNLPALFEDEKDLPLPDASSTSLLTEPTS